MYPKLERGSDIEVGAPRNGRPGYKWVTGWVVRYSENRVSTPMRRKEALFELARAKMKTAKQTVSQEFEHHAARAFFASAWADQMEENDSAPWGPGGEIMDYMPDDIDPAAIHAARTLRMDIERANGKSIFDLMAIIERDGDGDRDNTAEMFGHYAAMQAMGHGVGLRDAFGAGVAKAVKVPYVEFSSCSLEKDY